MWRNRYFGFVLQLPLALSLLLTGPAPAWANPPTIAVILPKTPEHLGTIHQVFLKKFSELAADQPVPRFYLQSPNDDYLSLRNSARKAVALGADLIIAYGTSAAMAAKSETFQTPVIFADAIEPEAIGLVTQNKHDNQLATGVRGNAPLQTIFKLLRDMTNTLKLALILDGDSTDKQLTAVIKDAAGRRGLDVVPVYTHEKSPALIMRTVLASGANGLLFIEAEEKYDELLVLALQNKLPTVSIAPELAEKGALLGMEVSAQEQGQALAEIVLEILAGEYPEEIPIVTPRKTDIVINLKTAQQCGLQVPFEALAQATKVIR